MLCRWVKTWVGVSDICPFTDLSSVPLREVAGCIHPGWTVCAISACPSLLCRCFSQMSTFSQEVPSGFSSHSIETPLRKTYFSLVQRTECSALFFSIMIFYNSLSIYCANKYSRSITWHILQRQYVIRSSCADFHISLLYMQYLRCKIRCYGFSSCNL